MRDSHAIQSDLQKEFRTLVKSAGRLMSMAGHVAGDTAADVRHAAGRAASSSEELADEGLKALKEQLHSLEKRLGTGVRQAETLARKHPYLTVGAALALGAGILLALTRRSR